MSSTSSNRPKKYICSYEGCEKGFTRSDHLQRHMLNHGDGSSTCLRCGLHFKRPDLLNRHMARHRQRDEEAGGEGFGIIESRKKLWKDANGNIVKKRPAPGEPCKASAKRSTADPNNPNQSALTECYNNSSQALNVEPPSPPKSMLSVESFEQFTHQLPDLPDEEDFMDSTVAPNMFDFLANSSWGSTSAASLTVADDMPFSDMFNPDTASSFNMPFTTMHNYNWLFDIGDATCSPISTNILLSSSVLPDSQGLSQENQSSDMQRQPARPLPGHDTFSFNKRITGNNMAEESYTQHLSLQHQRSVEGFQSAKVFQSSSMTSNGSAATPATTSFPPIEQSSALNLVSETGIARPTTISRASTEIHAITYPSTHHLDEPTPYTNTQGFSPIQPRTAMTAMDDSSRYKLIALLVNARLKTPEGLEITQDHPMLTLSAMQNYLELFFSRFNATYPLLHQPTFNPSQTEPLLLLSVLLLGATYCDKAIHRLAVCIHDILRAQIFQHSSFSATPELWILQTILLVECFGKSRAGQRQHDMSHLFHGLLINLIRRSDCQTVRQPTFSDAVGDLESNWRKAIDVELRKRLAFLCFLWDTQHAVLFSQSLCMSSFELRTTLPCNQTAWEATSAEEWWKYARKDPQVPYLSVLKAYMTPDSDAQLPQLNALSRLLVLHGLMSVQWDLKRRDQTALGVVSLSQSADQTRWQDRLAQSFDAWKADFDSYCMNMSLSLSDKPERKAEFTRFSTATVAIYHAAHIILNVEILDLQIYAGANHILGLPVTRTDYERSRRVVKDWAKPVGSTPAARAAWHAANLLREGIMNLDNWDTNDTFHYPWCLYLSTLTCWAFHYANTVDTSPLGSSSSVDNTSSCGTGRNEPRVHPRPDNDMVNYGNIWQAKAEMNALVSSMTSVGPQNIWRALGKYPTSGLTAVIAKHLSNIRWAVVHEAMKVLKGLIQERSTINEYEALLK